MRRTMPHLTLNKGLHVCGKEWVWLNCQVNKRQEVKRSSLSSHAKRKNNNKERKCPKAAGWLDKFANIIYLYIK